MTQRDVEKLVASKLELSTMPDCMFGEPTLQLRKILHIEDTKVMQHISIRESDAEELLKALLGTFPSLTKKE